MSVVDTWISPWSNEQLTADELIREVALDVISQIYLVSLLDLPYPQLSFEPDAVIVKSSTIDYEYDIPFPKVLFDRMTESFTGVLAELKQEYLTIDRSAGKAVPSGEKVGSMLRYFKAMERLIRISTAVRCSSERKVLAVHGLPAEYSPLSLENDLRGAGFHYLVIYPNAGNAGSGNFRTVSMTRAISLINSLWPKQPGIVEKFFDLEKEYGAHLWMSDNNTWISAAPEKLREGHRSD